MKRLLWLCPFCGGEAFLMEQEDWPDCARRPTIYYSVCCKTEGCRCDDGEYYLTTEKEAIEQWNKRG